MKKEINTHGLKMERLDIIARKSDVLRGQGAYGNHYFQIFYDTISGRISYEEHIGDGYAKTGSDEICVGFIRNPITQQELADWIAEEMQKYKGEKL